MKVSSLIKKHGKEETIKILNKCLSNFLMMTKTHFKYAELIKKAKCLIEKGKLDELEELDKELKELEHYDMWD